MIRVADYIMKRLEEEKVKNIFYVPGGQCFYLTDALRRNKNLNPVAMHHEQSAAMAALSSALYTENIGACLVTTGCSGTNTMTGLLHAWQDSIPCVFISGQQNYNLTVKGSGLPLRQFGVQEADIETIAKPLTKFAVTVESESKIAYYMDKALYLAREGRKGPVWIDVPLNVQNSMVDESKLEHFTAEENILAVSGDDIDDIKNAIESAKRPIILAGHGVRSAGAVDELKQLAASIKIPIVFTRFSCDMMPYDSPYNIGVVGGAGGASRHGNFAIQNSDLVISIGCRLAVETVGPDFDKFAREAKIYVVDIDEIEHSKKGVRIDKFIHADAKDVLTKLNKANISKTPDEWLEKCHHWKDIFDYNKPFNPEYIDMRIAMTKISKLLPDGGTVISDAGFSGASVAASTHANATQRIIPSYAQGEMGYAVPGACGIAAETDKPVVAYTGDGSLMMNLQEIQTVVRNNFNIKIVIINNNGYGGVRHGQKAHFRGKTIGTCPGDGIDFPDYGKIADAFGIRYFRVNSVDEFDDKVEGLFTDNNPVICEIMVDPEQFDLHNGFVTYGKRKYGFRPIEDQSPFMDRELFFKEMIVKPDETSYGTPV
jgi:acetolactate synthase-1/2/3 large subunit